MQALIATAALHAKKIWIGIAFWNSQSRSLSARRWGQTLKSKQSGLNWTAWYLLSGKPNLLLPEPAREDPALQRNASPWVSFVERIGTRKGSDNTSM